MRTLCFFSAVAWPNAMRLPSGARTTKLALAVGSIDGAVDVAPGEGVELRLEFGVELVDVVDIDVIGEASGAGRCGAFSVFVSRCGSRWSRDARRRSRICEASSRSPRCR